MDMSDKSYAHDMEKSGVDDVHQTGDGTMESMGLQGAPLQRQWVLLLGQ